MTGGVLWDLDGTLIDSEEKHWLSWRDTIAAEGISITRDQFLATFGLRNDAIVPRWLPPGASSDQIQRVSDAKEALYWRLVRQEGLEPLPGAAEWVRQLHHQQWQQAIASSAPRENFEVVLEVIGLTGCFQAIVSAEDVTAGKPDPQVFLTAAARLGVPPSRCIVVEDAAAGVEAGQRGGMLSIGVSRNGSGLKADWAISSLTELPPDAFERLLGSRGSPVQRRIQL
jgi:HAD superfamily hydrolase (TIGR01509 family)